MPGYDPTSADVWRMNPNGSLIPFAPGSSMASGAFSSSSSSTPAYTRVTSIPGWLPPSDMHELVDQYGKTGEMFGTSEYDTANQRQQSRVLTTALNAGNNAATEYANRARQSGGSGMGAGLVKAQAAVGGQRVAGEMELDRQKFDASQREKAATHASQIATTLAGLRDSYLKTIVDYATKSDSTMADFTSKMAAINSNRVNDTSRNSGPSQFNPGYVTNSGPIRPASINGQSMPNASFGSYPTTWLSGYHS